MKIFTILKTIWLALVVAGLTVILIANIYVIVEQQRLDSTAPAEYKRITIQDKDKILAGSVLKYELDFCRYVDKKVKTDVLVTLVPQDNKSLADIPLGVAYANPDSRCATVQTERLIPTETLTGKYKLQICGYYYVIVGKGPKSVCITSDEFDIKKAAANAVELNTIQKQLDQLRAKMVEPINITSITPVNTPKSPPPVPEPTWSYKVYSPEGTQLGAYKQPENAVKKYRLTGGLAKILDRTGKDVTKPLLGGIYADR